MKRTKRAVKRTRTPVPEITAGTRRCRHAARSEIQPAFQSCGLLLAYYDFRIRISGDYDFHLAVEPRVEPLHARYVDDVPAVGAEESRRVELTFERVERLIHRKGPTVFQVQAGDAVVGDYMADRISPYDKTAVFVGDKKPAAVLQVASRNKAVQPVEILAHAACTHVNSLAQRSGKLLSDYGLQQVADAVIVERTYGIFVVGSGEYDGATDPAAVESIEHKTVGKTDIGYNQVIDRL